MNTVLAQNKLSGFLNTLNAGSVTDLYSYGLYDNVPGSIVKYVSVRPDIPASTTAPYLAEVNFKIPRVGLLKVVWVKTVFTPVITGALADATNVGQRMFSNLNLNVQGAILCENSPHFVAAKQSILDICESQEHSRLTQPSRSMVSASGEITIMTPFYCANFEKPNLYLDTKYLEQMYITGIINNQIDMGLSSATFTGFSQTLECQFVEMNDEVYQMYNARQFPSGEALNMITYDTVHQQLIETGTSATTATMEIQLSGVCPYQFVSVNARPAAGAASEGYSPNVSINNLTLSLTGTNVYSSVSVQTLRAFADQYAVGNQLCTLAGATSRLGAVGALATNSKQVPIPLFWSQVKDATFQSGSIAYSYVHNPQLTITHQAASGTPSRVTMDLVSVYFKNLIVDSSNGFVQSTRSS